MPGCGTPITKSTQIAASKTLQRGASVHAYSLVHAQAKSLASSVTRELLTINLRGQCLCSAFKRIPVGLRIRIHSRSGYANRSL